MQRVMQYGYSRNIYINYV